MSTRFLRFAGFVPAALLAILIAPAGAEQPSAPRPCPRAANSGLVTCTYAVADLVIPVDREPKRIFAGPARAEQVKPKKTPASPSPTREEMLIKLIEDTIQPRSWGDRGGTGTIDYFPLTMSLVINQTPDVQDQIGDLLAALRRLQDQEVALEVRLVSVPEDFFCIRLGVDFNNPGPDGPKVSVSNDRLEDVIPKEGGVKGLDESQLVRLLETVQGDVRSCIMQAPKLTLFNGQRTTMCVGDEQAFVTGVEVRNQDGQSVIIPKTETYTSGIELDVQPVISADRRSVRVDLHATLQDVDTSAPMQPVIVPITPIGGDSDAKPVPFTQFIQQPRVQKRVVEKNFTVPNGRTMILDGGKRRREVCTRSCPPVLEDIPYLNDLFTTESRDQVTERVLLLVTPRIIVGEEEEKAKPAAKSPVDELLKHFQAAYKEGKYEEAEKWAQMGQELDPDNGVCSTALYMARRQKAAHAERPLSSCAAEESADEVCPAAKCVQEKVSGLLAQYRKACAAGRLDEAHDLARKALDIDPACFSKPRR